MKERSNSPQKSKKLNFRKKERKSRKKESKKINKDRKIQE